MTEAKFKDIVSTMVEFGWLDPFRAMYDPEYLVNQMNMYIEAANIAREIMHMEPIL